MRKGFDELLKAPDNWFAFGNNNFHFDDPSTASIWKTEKIKTYFSTIDTITEFSFSHDGSMVNMNDCSMNQAVDVGGFIKLNTSEGIIKHCSYGNFSTTCETLTGSLIGGVQNGSINLSVPELSSYQKISVYPNPATKDIFINQDVVKEIMSIDIINISGKSISVTASGDKINISDFPPGFYFLKIKTKGQTFTGKFVKVNNKRKK